ncbi:hypothetical protein TNCV_4050431 [Trichonephila clavipes]|nr:hypothetical protein TNCV_4050431 [Trichonephila clavipes]
MSPNVGDKLGDHGNPAPNNPVWQPYRGIVTLCIELFSYAPDFSRPSISRLFWQVQEVSDRKLVQRLKQKENLMKRVPAEIAYAQYPRKKSEKEKSILRALHPAGRRAEESSQLKRP